MTEVALHELLHFAACPLRSRVHGPPPPHFEALERTVRAFCHRVSEGAVLPPSELKRIYDRQAQVLGCAPGPDHVKNVEFLAVLPHLALPKGAKLTAGALPKGARLAAGVEFSVRGAVLVRGYCHLLAVEGMRPATAWLFLPDCIPHQTYIYAAWAAAAALERPAVVVAMSYPSGRVMRFLGKGGARPLADLMRAAARAVEEGAFYPVPGPYCNWCTGCEAYAEARKARAIG